ncbi:MAG TPA: universal stress protein [Gemmataceae bacterium]|nr:universal stress protein [Gemmataceae bacterium]
MYRSLLVPLDGSTFGEQALPLALSIAHRAKAVLRLAHVHVPLAAMYVEGVPFLDNDLESEAKEHERAYLDAVVKRLASDPAVSLTSTLLEGPIANALLEYAAAVGVDLLIMTTHGRGPLSRFWLGSVADQLVRQAPMPILLVRPREGSPELPGGPCFRHILIPLDGSPLAEQAIEPAVALGSLFEVGYTLLRVVNPLQTVGHDPAGFAISGFDPLVQKRLQVEAEDYLERIAERLRPRATRVLTRVIVGAQPAAAILDAAREQGADLIALATHGRGGLRRLLLGSIADKVLRGATTPVLVRRPLDS